MATGGEEDEIVVVTISDQPTADDTCVGTESAVVVDFKAADTSAGQSQDGMETVYSASTLLQKMDDSSEETDKGADDSSEDSNTIYPITCGDTKACLIWKKFVCPGINVKCVKFQSDMISPKEFVNMAGKSTLKDWKRAIRLRGVMLRKVMDSGELDFYQHEKVCTNTCRSTKFDILINNVRSSNLIGSQGEYMLSSTPTDVNGTQGGSGEEGNKECSELGSTPTGLLTPSTPSSECNKSRYTEDVPEDVFALWRGISEVGLLGEVVSEVQQEIQDTLKSLRQRIQQSPLQVNDVAILNNVVQQFGLMDNVKKIISNHKGQMDRYKDQYTRDLADLEQQCDEQRKRYRSRSAQMSAMPPSTPTPSKRPRLQRVPSAVLPVTPNTPMGTALPTITAISIGKIPTLATINVGRPPSLSLNASSPVTYSAMLSSPGTPGSGGSGGITSGGVTVLGSSNTGLPPGLTVLSAQSVQDGKTLLSVGPEGKTILSSLKVINPLQLLSASGDGFGTLLQGATQVVSASGGTVMTLQPVVTTAELSQLTAVSTVVSPAITAAPVSAVTVEGDQAALQLAAIGKELKHAE
uniref:glucocorticoid modulatory element-binding protein 2-like isoform X2 n=1 Tax=Myxine glutinosa TaxID=7769 RepID=UPI00358DEED3